ncbi:50S ribosomal protein L18 [Lamprobacter modestohalophilus]|uniref:Large ribosomal subunit protein uL18 n=1 Tax=Lamprobacter modestohalophilus TaxID=1064514 RepID=A0A9X0W7A3_9GAMM|nr:50S ribosomal protein L18 [Lamprobacter modestohalophilus]MCF7976555.1 50S ribosomal protein L18 [Chromatiaceae bacterium]MBK1618109.1 50S ribosomal protein L18 [Lamprobacter modestohalophilus]MCF7993937.1 50S ribosomal protein L18 [Chromatiaceae bacterium]MCF8003364.1 50S ribosomal protein L18 [Chromatiaceae bacterium]MCF8015169.1 50S ribosomal protein L18 [Chromatiaceae bacterium]
MDKKHARLRRATRARAKIREIGGYRLCIYRTPRHIYAQVIGEGGDRVIACASTVEKELKAACEGHTGNVSAAAKIGHAIAERARSAGVEKVSFDRSGFKYHGRVKALADSAREHGLQF